MKTFNLSLCSSALAIAAFLTSCSSQAPTAQEQGNELARLVESLASPNKEPTLVDGPKDGFPRKLQTPPEFDLAAQDRINAAWDQLSAEGLKAFPYLIDHFEDERYCTSVEMDDWWSNRSVGQVCPIGLFAT